MSDRGKSLISFLPQEKPSHCGYCKGEGSLCAGLWAHFLTVDDYQAMLNQGWRRSGRYVYKPDNAATCCPLYTIRCRAAQYQPTRSQKKVAKKVRNYLERGKREESGGEETTTSKESGDKQVPKSATSLLAGEEQSTAPAESSESATHKIVSGLKKAKIRRLERLCEKRKGSDGGEAGVVSVTKDGTKGLYDLIPATNCDDMRSLNRLQNQDTCRKSAKHKLELRLIRADPKDPEFQKHFEESYQVYVRYQTSVHGDTEEECDEETYKRFLCGSPLLYETRKVGEKSVLLGAFHQHYLIDGRIAAVGVIDILPECVSSVYLYYDPEYSHLSLGTYSALREIQLTVQLGLSYYYMGYYIHSCVKMRYKGRFLPSDLLSPTRNTWHLIEDCLPLLEKQKYCTFEELSVDQKKQAAVAPSKANRERVRIFMDGDVYILSQVEKAISAGARSKLEDFLGLAGSLADRLIYVLIDEDDESDEEAKD